jgi:hypothetical protein
MRESDHTQAKPEIIAALGEGTTPELWHEN